MNAKHTPGPWQINPIENSGRYSVSAPSPSGGGRNVIDEAREGDALLIAAAPDLLAALQAAVTYLEAHRPKGKIRDIFTELNSYENTVMRPARAAIEKALTTSAEPVQKGGA